MSILRRIYKENAVYNTMDFFHKKNEIMEFVGKCMDLELNISDVTFFMEKYFMPLFVCET